ncbi:hypothetical protein ACIRNY_10990 [Capnocytophaga canimorsus]|uniref:hypothetical protein n=1 Tax=Capnocytophaga canimorsus TaxID=28188 RepID=UPI00384A54F7
MKREEVMHKALELLKPYAERYEPNVKDAWWVEYGDFNSEDFCPDCIDEALYELRMDYLLEQRKRPINKRDNPFTVFEKHSYYSAEESDRCETLLHYIIIPNKEEIERVIDYISTENIDDYIGYQAYHLLDNDWGESDNITEQESREWNLKLAELVVKILEQK